MTELSRKDARLNPMKRILLPICMLFLILACSLPTQTPVPGQSTAIAPATDAAAPVSPIVPGITPETTAPGLPAVGSGDVPIQILSPLDGAVVNTPQVEIVGLTSAGAVVSVNDDILIVGSDGQFKIVVALDEGPNVVEIIASDAAGNEGYILLSVFYEP